MLSQQTENTVIASVNLESSDNPWKSKWINTKEKGYLTYTTQV